MTALGRAFLRFLTRGRDVPAVIAAAVIADVVAIAAGTVPVTCAALTPAREPVPGRTIPGRLLVIFGTGFAAGAAAAAIF